MGRVCCRRVASRRDRVHLAARAAFLQCNSLGNRDGRDDSGLRRLDSLVERRSAGSRLFAPLGGPYFPPYPGRLCILPTDALPRFLSTAAPPPACPPPVPPQFHPCP